MFFGNRSLGSLTETECQLVFNKMVLDLSKPSAQKNISQDIGVRLLYSSESYMENRLERHGYDASTVRLITSSVGRKAFKSDKNYGDIYGWYVIEVAKRDSGVKKMFGRVCCSLQQRVWVQFGELSVVETGVCESFLNGL